MKKTDWPMFIVSTEVTGHECRPKGTQVDLTIPALLWMAGEAPCPISGSDLIVPTHTVCAELTHADRVLALKGRLFSVRGSERISEYGRIVRQFGGWKKVLRRKRDFDAAEALRKRAAAMFLDIKRARVVRLRSERDWFFDPISEELVRGGDVRGCDGERPGFAYAVKKIAWNGVDPSSAVSAIKDLETPTAEDVLDMNIPRQSRLPKGVPELNEIVASFAESRDVDELSDGITCWNLSGPGWVAAPDRSRILVAGGSAKRTAVMKWTDSHLSVCAGLASSLKGFAFAC